MYLSVHSLRRIISGVVMVAATTGVSSAQDLKAKLPTDPNVVTGKLENGLTYYIRTNHKPEKKVELRMMVKAGSILEDEKQLGLAHFMEHMNFNGTKNFQKNDLVSYLQSIGVQFGADLNAYTAFDQTVYILPIPTDKPGNLEKGFQIIEDWSHNALLTDKDIDDERGVVLEESRLGKGAGDRMLKKYFPKLASGSLYAERLPIGKDDVLKTFKYDEIRRFYKDWYRPDLQAVAVVGDIDVATAKKMIEDHFGKIKNPSNEKKRNYIDVKARTQPEAMVVTDKEATNYSIQILFPYVKKQETVTMGDYRRDMIRELAAQMMNRRLQELAQSSNPPFPFAGVGIEGLVHGYESLVAVTAFTSAGPEKALNALTGELQRAKQFGFNESELELAKKDMMSQYESAYNERNTTDSKDYVEEYIRNFLDNETMPGIANEYAYHQQLVPGIKVDEVNNAVKALMNDQNTFTLITGPDKQDVKLPTDNELVAMTTKGLNQETKQAEEKKVASSLMATMPAPGKITGQQKEDGFDATTYTLSNGIKVTIKPTEFKSDEILLKGIKKGGSNSYGLADRSNVHFATDLVDAMGIGAFNPTDLEKVLAGKKVELSMSIGEIEDDIAGSSTIKDFESMLQVLYLSMMQPRKDAELFEAYKDKSKSMLQFISANPQAVFSDTTVKTLYNNNPLARMAVPKAADFEKLDLDRSLAIYRDEFGSADGFHFFIVGNIKPEAALPLIEQYIGSIPVSNKPVAYKDNGVRTVTGKHELKVKKGTEKKSMILSFYTGDIKYSEDVSLKAQAVAELLNIKVIEDLREKMGGIYTGGFRSNVTKEPYEHYSVVLQLPCGPENVDKLLAAANEEIEALKAKGPDEKDVAKVKNQWREKHRTDIVENKYWNEKMTSVLFWGRDKDRVLKYDSYIEKLTPAELQAAAKQLFTGNSQFTSILYPES